MVSVGASLDQAIVGLQRNVDLAVRTASQLSRSSDDLSLDVEPESGASAESGAGDMVGGIIDVSV